MTEKIPPAKESSESELPAARFEEMTLEIVEAMDTTDLGAGSHSLVNLASELRWHPKESKPWAEGIRNITESEAAEFYPSFHWVDIRKLQMMLRIKS